MVNVAKASDCGRGTYRNIVFDPGEGATHRSRAALGLGHFASGGFSSNSKVVSFSRLLAVKVAIPIVIFSMSSRTKLLVCIAEHRPVLAGRDVDGEVRVVREAAPAHVPSMPKRAVVSMLMSMDFVWIKIICAFPSAGDAGAGWFFCALTSKLTSWTATGVGQDEWSSGMCHCCDECGGLQEEGISISCAEAPLLRWFEGCEIAGTQSNIRGEMAK